MKSTPKEISRPRSLSTPPPSRHSTCYCYMYIYIYIYIYISSIQCNWSYLIYSIEHFILTNHTPVVEITTLISNLMPKCVFLSPYT
jgi:hypothetical protein